MLAYLDDGLEERMQEDEDDTASQNILRLHPNLAPIKVIILAEDPSNEEQLDLVNRLAKELKIAGKYNNVPFLKYNRSIGLDQNT